MNSKTKRIIFSVLAVALAALLCACSSTPKINSGKKDEVKKDTFVSATLDGVTEDIEKYNKYKDNYESAFSNPSPTSAQEFEYTLTERGVRVDAYKGESDIIIIPDLIDGKSVVEISEKAFFESSLRSIYVPDSVKYIGKGAFSECNELTLLRLSVIGDGEENTHAGYIFGADTYETNAINTPVSLEMIVVGSKCKSVDARSFYGMKSIEAIALEGAESIGEFAFYGCSELVFINLPDTLTSIENYAFGECTSLAKIVIPDSVKKIGFGALYSCRALCDLTLSVIGDGGENTHIGYIFGGEHSEWNENFVPQRLRIVTIGEGCTRIEGKAFANCNKIVQINFPESIELIGIRAFVNCRSLKEISTPSGLDVISGDAFFGCDNMTKLEIKGDTKIESQAFFGCDKLEDKIISSGATISDDAFDK